MKTVPCRCGIKDAVNAALNYVAFVTNRCKGSEGKDQSSICGFLIPNRTHTCILAFYGHVQKRDPVVSQPFDSKFQVVMKRVDTVLDAVDRVTLRRSQDIVYIASKDFAFSLMAGTVSSSWH